MRINNEMDGIAMERFRSDSDRAYEEFQASHLMTEYSPSVPHDFPPELIPSGFLSPRVFK